jgi:hypothetical protein
MNHSNSSHKIGSKNHPGVVTGDFGSGLTRLNNTGVIDQHIEMPMPLCRDICRRSNR